MRVGQKNGLVYQWAKKGTRPRQPKDQRYANAYVFGAVCPARDAGAALVMPRADTEAMQKHLEEISRNVAAGAQAVLILDKTGWHTTDKLEVPANITLVFLPPASLELNPAENIWQYLRQTWLSNRVFESYEAICDLRSLLSGVEEAHRRDRPQPNHRHQTLGHHRSEPMKAGIRISFENPVTLLA